MMIVKAACRLKVQQFTMALEDARVPALFSHSRTTRGKKERKKKRNHHHLALPRHIVLG